MNCETADLLHDLDQKAQDACAISWRTAFKKAAETIRQLDANVGGGDTAIAQLQQGYDDLFANNQQWASDYKACSEERQFQQQRAEKAEAAVREYETGMRELANLFAIVAPQCTPMDSLSGLVSQVNNYIAGMREENERLERVIRFIDYRVSWTNIERAGFVVDVPAIQPMGISFMSSVMKEMRECQPPF